MNVKFIMYELIYKSQLGIYMVIKWIYMYLQFIRH